MRVKVLKVFVVDVVKIAKFEETLRLAMRLAHQVNHFYFVSYAGP